MGVGIIGIGFIPNVNIEEVPKLEKKKISNNERLYAKCWIFRVRYDA